MVASRSQPRNGVVAAAARGDPVAFSALVTAHHADLLRVCYVILGDAALAEDAAQSAWIQAWRKLGHVREERKVRSWLVAVAANEARQIARRRRRRDLSSSEPAYGADADPALADLTIALARISPDERRLLGLRYVAGLTSAEMGTELGISAGAVRHRLMRLLARLRSEMDQ